MLLNPKNSASLHFQGTRIQQGQGNMQQPPTTYVARSAVGGRLVLGGE